MLLYTSNIIQITIHTHDTIRQDRNQNESKKRISVRICAVHVRSIVRWEIYFFALKQRWIVVVHSLGARNRVYNKWITTDNHSGERESFYCVSRSKEDKYHVSTYTNCKLKFTNTLMQNFDLYFLVGRKLFLCIIRMPKPFKLCIKG